MIFCTNTSLKSLAVAMLCLRFSPRLGTKSLSPNRELILYSLLSFTKMTIKIKCPVCNAGNLLTVENLSCRRCKENLSLLYKIKGYSYKYRLYLLQMLHQPCEQQRQIAQSARWLCDARPVQADSEKLN